MDWSDRLRTEISASATRYAERHQLPHYQSRGTPPTVLFAPAADGTHGNFLPTSYQAIRQDQHWQGRLDKRHPRPDALPPPPDGEWKELDSSNSSDALLMNVFCHPGLPRSRVAQLFGGEALPRPEFGVPGELPFHDGTTDRTEIDMRLGNCLVEAKLTEADFTAKPKGHVEQYADFGEVFEASALPQEHGTYLSYQLLRNVLAAHAHSRALVVICDARRPDLLRAWWEVVQAIKPLPLRLRCQFLLWQEIATVAPPDLQAFLREKYGIA